MSKRFKATLSMFLCAVMVLCSVAVGGMFANADTNTGKAIQLVKDGAAANITGGQVSNIYFGNYAQSDKTGSTKDPIKWRVLANNTSSKQLFLLSDQGLDAVQYHTAVEDVTWEKSTIRSWLNETFYKAAFNSSEQGMIKSTTVTADVNPEYSTDPGNDTTDKVFLLSINEVNKYFSSDEARKCVPTDYAINKGASTSDSYKVDGKATCWWWLRSPGCYGGDAARVYSDGGVAYYGFNVRRGSSCVRPAFNLNLESVIFTSAAVGGKISSAEGGDAISKIADYSGNDWKVTLKDSNRNFDITDKTAKTGKPGETITLSYTGATIYNKDSTPNEYISVIITDSNGNAIYYGRVAQPTSTNGKVDIKIPSDLTNGEYTLNVFSEQYNGGANDDTKLTDYASEFSTIKLTVCDHTGNTNKATCTEPCLCSICTKELSPATGHAYANPVFAWAEDNTAKVTFTCSNDKTHTLTKDCNITSETTKKATCTEKGEITYTASYTLDDKEYKDEKKVPTDATGHSFDANGKCTKAECGYVCTHTESTDKPTCEKSAVCSECGATLPATGHTFGEWKVTKSATFFKDGVETRICVNEGCTETETRVVLSKFSEFKSGLFGVDFLKAILTVFADLLTSVC